MTIINKQNIIYLCICIIIILILRTLYKRQTYVKNSNHNTINNINEGFEIDNINDNETEIDNENVVDLLSKTNSNQIIENISFNNKNMIKSWTTKIYNMMSQNKLNKEFAFYQPNLLNNQYCKLGDMISENKDYSPPNSNQISLLIKKGVSDIKPPVSFDLIVNFGGEYSNTKYYEFESLIKNSDTMNLIKSNISKCANTFVDLNTIITKNINNLDFNLSKNILSNTEKLYIKFNNNRMGLSNLVNNSITLDFTYHKEGSADTLIIPMGINCVFEFHNIEDIRNGNSDSEIRRQIKEITLPLSINSQQSYDAISLISNIPDTNLFHNLNKDRIMFETFEYNIFSLISILDIINYIKDLCENIIIIYDKENTNINFLNYINLIDNKDILLKILENIEICKSFLSSYDDINSITLNSNPELIPYFNTIIDIPITNNKLLYYVFFILKNMKIRYILPYLLLSINNDIIRINENFTNIENKNETATKTKTKNESNKKNSKEKFSNFFQKLEQYKYLQTINNGYIAKNVKFTNYDNKFLATIPKNNYNIFNSTVYIQANIKTLLEPLGNFAKFQSDLSNNAINNLPLKIYKPLAPPRYRSIGHIFCNIQSQLTEIKEQALAGNGICCVPEHCVKDVRDWNITDKVFEYNKDNVYWAIYANPYTGTFISTNTNQLPEGKVVKVIACVKKCTAVEELKKADECARKYYNINKKIKNEVKLTPDIVNNQEEEYYLDKIKAQSDSIARLSSKAQNMQLTLDKATIVNREMNKNKLQNYVDTQKNNIDIIMKQLVKDKNSIQTNINIPINVLNKLIEMIKKSKDIPEEQKVALVSKLINNEKMMEANIINKTEYEKTINRVLSSCPNYDLSGLVRKDLVSDVCYGCDM